VLKRTYYMAVIDGVFCLERTCDEQTRNAVNCHVWVEWDYGCL